MPSPPGHPPGQGALCIHFWFYSRHMPGMGIPVELRLSDEDAESVDVLMEKRGHDTYVRYLRALVDRDIAENSTQQLMLF